MPLGDSGLLLRFGEQLSDVANQAAIETANTLEAARLPGVVEISPGLISTFLRYDPEQVSFTTLAAEVRMCLSAEHTGGRRPAQHEIGVVYGGDGGPDLAEVAEACGMGVPEFIEAHTTTPLRVLATGFAPGFVYCGMHDDAMTVPRRIDVRPRVPAGSVLFAAGQTAIAATAIPTGWHVIGRTRFNNFDALRQEPTSLRAGDNVYFHAVRAP